MPSEIATPRTTPRNSVSIHLPENMRRASMLADPTQTSRRATITPRQSNLAIHAEGDGALDPASILGTRARRTADPHQPDAALLLTRDELTAYTRNPSTFIQGVRRFTTAEEASMKPVVTAAASASSMAGAHLRAGLQAWLLSFWMGAWAEEGGKFADASLAEYGIPEGMLSAVGFTLVGGSLAHLVGGPVAGGIRMGQGGRTSPDDADLANLATLRAQKLRALLSCSGEYFRNLDQAKVDHLQKMVERDNTFGHSSLRKCMPAAFFPEGGAAWRGWLTDDATYIYWHVLLSIGAITAPHLIDRHFGPDLADRLYSAGARLTYKIIWGGGASALTLLSRNWAAKWFQNTDGDPSKGSPNAPKRGIHSPEGIEAHLAAWQKKDEILELKEAKLYELHSRIIGQIHRKELTREEAEPLLADIAKTEQGLRKDRLRLKYKMAKLRSTLGRDWLQIQNLAAAVFKGKNKALPPHLKGVLTQGALKMRSLANLLGCWTAIGTGTAFSYYNVSQLGPRPDPHEEGVTGAEVALVVTNTVFMMELWKLRSPIGRYLFEPALSVGVGLAEGTAKAVSTAVNWCCGKQREDRANLNAHMQTEQIDLEAPAERPAPGDLTDPTRQMLLQFSQAADMLLNSRDEGETDHARFGEFLNEFAAKAKRDGNQGLLQHAFESLPPEALELVVECEFLNAGHSGELAELARNCLLDLVDVRNGVHEVKVAAIENHDDLSQEDLEQIKAFLFDNAMMRNLWPAVHAGDPEAMRRAYTESKFGVHNLLQRIDPAHAKQENVEAKVMELLEAFWSSLGQEFPQLVETLFDSLPRDELTAIMQRSDPLRLPAQQSLDGRVTSRTDAGARAFDKEIEGHLRIATRDPQARYQYAIDGIRQRDPRKTDAQARIVLMDSIADLLATRAMSNLEVRALFDGLRNEELDAIRTYRSAPGTQVTWQQGNVMRMARDCLARNTGVQAGATADEFATWLGAANSDDYLTGYQHQLNLAAIQLQLAELPDAPENRREWLMDSIALALMTARIDENKLVALFRSLPSEERAAIVACAPGAHAPDMALRVTICARLAATQRREVLGADAEAAFRSAFGANPEEMPAAAAKAATAYEAYWRAVLRDAIETPSDKALNDTRVALVAHLGKAAATDLNKVRGDAVRVAHDKLTIPAPLTRAPT